MTIAVPRQLLRILIVSALFILALVFMQAWSLSILGNSTETQLGIKTPLSSESTASRDIPTPAIPVVSKPVDSFPSPAPPPSFAPSFKFIKGKTGERDAVVEYSNICLDSEGLFYPGPRNSGIELPVVNVAGSADYLDIHFSPNVRPLTQNFTRTDRVVFALGGVWAYQLVALSTNS
jgi:hypothetical protein